jgi:hypothetical protein
MGAKNSRPSANKPGAGLREDTLTRVHQRDVLSSKQRSVSQRSPAIPRNPLSWSTGSLPDRLEYDASTPKNEIFFFLLILCPRPVAVTVLVWYLMYMVYTTDFWGEFILLYFFVVELENGKPAKRHPLLYLSPLVSRCYYCGS